MINLKKWMTLGLVTLVSLGLVANFASCSDDDDDDDEEYVPTTSGNATITAKKAGTDTAATSFTLNEDDAPLTVNLTASETMTAWSIVAALNSETAKNDTGITINASNGQLTVPWAAVSGGNKSIVVYAKNGDKSKQAWTTLTFVKGTAHSQQQGETMSDITVTADANATYTAGSNGSANTLVFANGANTNSVLTLACGINTGVTWAATVGNSPITNAQGEINASTGALTVKVPTAGDANKVTITVTATKAGATGSPKTFIVEVTQADAQQQQQK